MDSLNIVDAALAGDKEAFMAAFNAAISTKVSDALEVKKVEIASNLITTEEPNEIQTISAEVDGSADAPTEEPAAASETASE